MNAGVTFLNYIIFFVLYLVSFYFFYKKNTEIIGFYLLFAVHLGCTIYNLSYLTSLNNSDTNTIPKIIIGAILTSGVLYTISLVFIIMMLSNMKIKFDKTFGKPTNLPPIYKNKLEEYKRLIIVTFSICTFMLIVLMIFYDNVNIISITSVLRSNQEIWNNKFPLIMLIISAVPVIISAIELNTANRFSVLTRQELMK
jgi:hypothetical protein